MLPTDLGAARDLLQKAVDAVRDGEVLGDSELRDALGLTRELARLVSQVQVETVAALDRSGAFAAEGYKRPDSAVANLLTVERGRAAEITRAAARVCPRVDPQGQPLPASLPATAAVFAAGAASLAHVEAIGRLLDGGAARRLSPTVWAQVEELLAAHADEHTPAELRAWGARLIEAYDRDGPAPEDDDHPPAHVNELRLTPLRGGGVTVVGRFEDPVRAAAIRTVIDAKAAPLTAHDQRGTAERQADALAEVLRFVLDHGDTILPCAGGERPRLNVHIELPDLQNRARAGCLDFGDTLHPTALRELCCDAGVVPIVLGGTGQPWMWAGPGAPSPTRYAARSLPEIADAPIPGVIDRRPGARFIIFGNGPRVARPGSTTWLCSAAPTTPRSIPRNGRCGSVGTGYRSSSPHFGWTGNKDHDADRESRPVGSSAPDHPAERKHHDRISHIVGGGTLMPAHPELDPVA